MVNIMENFIPILLVLLFFGVSFFWRRHSGSVLRFWISLLLMTYFLVMAYLERENKYSYLFFAVLAIVFALSTIWAIKTFSGRSSGQA